MNYLARYKDWILSDYFEEETKAELKEIEGQEKEIEDRFYKDLNFGTGGLRGIIGAGTNRMNKYTVQKATQGLANYIINYNDDGCKRGVVIAYDSRHKSQEFALEVALVLAANKIKAYLFDELRPVPELSFAVRELKAVAGVVITASHNPPEYNGYKVYGEDGGQVVPEQAREITAEIEEIDDFALVKTIAKKEAETSGYLHSIGAKIDEKYLAELLQVIPNKELAQKKGDKLSIIYTPLHGTGNKPVRNIFEKLGFTNLDLVKEQVEADPNFSTVESPNPEEISAFKMALKQAEKVKPDLILGTDPDCDRIGVIVKDTQDEYLPLTGNQVGVLIADYLLTQLKKTGELSKKGVIIKTIVSTEMVRKIAADYQVKVLDVLTGFKFIGEKITKFSQSGEYDFLFGFEESYGYLAGTYARDKDGVIAAALIATMALEYKTQGKTILTRLTELREKYGYYLEDLVSLKLTGKVGQEKIKKTLKKLRQDKLKTISGLKVNIYKDYLEKQEYNYLSKKEKEINLPKSNVLQYLLADDSVITIRPSGTEPKLKIYFAVRGTDEKEAKTKINKLKKVFIQDINNIIEELV